MTDLFDRFIGAEAATKEAVGSQLPGRENGPADAYRHIIWAAEMTRRFGEVPAGLILSGHEFKLRSPVQDEKDKRLIREELGLDYQPPPRDGEEHPDSMRDASSMDDHNNAIGIKIGRDAKDYEEVIRKAQQAIERGNEAWKEDPASVIAGRQSDIPAWEDPRHWRNNPKTNEPDPVTGEIEGAPWNWPDTDWSKQVPEKYKYHYGDARDRQGYWEPDDIRRVLMHLEPGSGGSLAWMRLQPFVQKIYDKGMEAKTIALRGQARPVRMNNGAIVHVRSYTRGRGTNVRDYDRHRPQG